MKKILIAVFIFISAYCYSQPTGYINVNERRNSTALSTQAFTGPAGTTPALTTGQWKRAGAIYTDTTGANKGFYAYWDGAWHRLADTAYTGFATPYTSLGSGYKILTSGIKSLVAGENINIDSLTSGSITINSRKIDVFLIGGQSNAVGNPGGGGAASSPDPQSGTVYQYYSGSFSAVTDEVGAANTGSAWPSF